MSNNELKFKGRIIRNIYSSEDFKTYAVDVSKEEYPFIKFTKYGNCTITGNLHSLSVGEEYDFTCIEQNNQYGYSYKVLNIRKDKPRNEQDVYLFLQEFLTFNQASEIYREYPTIIDMVLNGEDDKIDLNKLHGIGKYTFENIKEKIINNYMLFDLVAEFGNVLSISIIKKLYDKFVSVEKLRTELRVRPYSALTQISRVGFKTADTMLLKLEKEGKLEFASDLKTSKDRCMACMTFLLEKNEEEGNTRMSIPELRKAVMKLCPACANHFVDCINGNKDIYYSKETMDIALMSTYLTELKIAATILDGLKKKQVWDIDWESYRTKGEFPLSDEQLSSLGNACNEQIIILCGFAGSGKTATTNTLIKLLEDNNKTYMLVSPTGRASKVLSGYTGRPAGTVHRQYLYNPKDGWGYNEENKVDVDMVICDESSMADIFLFLHLLEGIDFNRTKLFIIGDPAQLCSVSAGNVLNDLISSKIIPTTTLSKIFRYVDGGLMQVATDTRNGKTFLKEKTEGFQFFGNNKDYAFLQCSNENIIKRTVALYEKLLQQGYKPEDIMVLTSQNKGDYGTIEINKQLQKVANKNYGSNKNMKIGDSIYYLDDLTMQIQNNYKATVYDENDFGYSDEIQTLIANGELGVIKDIDSSHVVIDFDGTLIRYSREDMQNVIAGYALTTHKSQGGSAKIVVFLTPSAHTFMLSSNLLYVGLTRTKEKCYHLGDMTTVNRAVKKKENVNRNTFLLSMLNKK